MHLEHYRFDCFSNRIFMKNTTPKRLLECVAIYQHYLLVFPLFLFKGGTNNLVFD